MRGGSASSKQRFISTRSSSSSLKSNHDGSSRKSGSNNNARSKREREYPPSPPAVKREPPEEGVKRKRGRPRLKCNEENVKIHDPEPSKTAEYSKPVKEASPQSSHAKDAGERVVTKEKRDDRLVRVKKENDEKDPETAGGSRRKDESSNDDEPLNVHVKAERKSIRDELNVSVKSESTDKGDEDVSPVKSEDSKEIDSVSSSNVGSPTSSVTNSHDGSSKPSKSSSRGRHRGPTRPGIDFNPGTRLEACDFMQKWYPSKIVDVDWDDREVLIHFERWSSRFDEWVSMDSPRLRAVTRTSARKEFRKKLQEEFKVGETVLARWVDGTMYPAKITLMDTNGTCQVTFRDDRVQKTVKLITLKKLSREEYAKIPSWIKGQLSSSSSSTNAEAEKQGGSRERRKSQEKWSGNDEQKRSKDRSSLHKTKPSGSRSQKPSSSVGLMVRRKKLLVGGIFQAKRPSTDAPKAKEPDVAKQESKQSPQTTKDGSPPPKNKLPAETVEDAVVKTEEEDDDQTPEQAAEDVGIRKKRASGGPAPKEFIIEEDHNHFKCMVEDCGKGFRKESLLASHMKHYHKNMQKTKSTASSKPDEPAQVKLNESLKQDETDVHVASSMKAKGGNETGSSVSSQQSDRKVMDDVKAVDQRLDNRAALSLIHI